MRSDRADQAAPREMIHQPDEEGQLRLVHPLFVEREDVEGLVVCSRKFEFETPSAMPLTERRSPMP
jgi:hypothetical protein